MKSNELMHYGVKNMRWRKGRKTPDNLQTDLARKTVNSDARIEKQKNLSLNGTTGKKFNVTEQNVDQTSERNDMQTKIAEEEQKAKIERQQAAKKALADSIKKAKKRQQETKTEEPVKTKTQSTSKAPYNVIYRRVAYINKPNR